MKTKFLLPLVLSSTLVAFFSHAQTTQVYTAEAKAKGALVYTEKHTTSYAEDGSVAKSTTEYFNPKGEKIAEISSEFSQSLSAPSHVFQDFRFKHRHGVRRDNNLNFILFMQDQGQPEKTKNFPQPKDDSVVMVGCQGLFFYLRSQYSEVKSRKKIPLLFLIPGSLDVFNFELEFLREQGNLAYFEIHIKNRFLRLFAPKLDVVYNFEKKEMVSYEGLSNLWNEQRKTQSVKIAYKYP